MAISKFTAGSALLKKAEVDTKIQAMHDACKKHGKHKMVKQPGDSQHPNDIKWALMNDSKKVYSGSIPMTAHTAGAGNKNLKPAITEINKAIDYINNLG